MKRTKKKYKKILIFFLIAIGVSLLIFYGNKIPQPSGGDVNIDLSSNPQINIDTESGVISPQGGALMSYQLYDSNGNLITTSNSLSIVDNVPGVSSIGLSVSAQSTITSPNLLCTPTTVWDSSPTNLIFSNALTDKSQKTLTMGGTVYWSTPTPMATSQFESASPTYFNVTLTCTYTIGGNTYNPTFNGFIKVNITEDTFGSGASVTVNLAKGGAPTSFCGDLVCNNATSPPDLGEDSTTCPADCAAPVINAKFRTFDSTYATGSAIAYTSLCGTILTRYGHVSIQSQLSSTCDNGATGMVSKGSTCGASPIKVIATIPGGYTTYTPPISLWQGSDSTKICICENKADGSYRFGYYSSGDADATKVSNSTTYSDPNTEVQC